MNLVMLINTELISDKKTNDCHLQWTDNLTKIFERKYDAVNYRNFLIFLLTACYTRTGDDAYKEGKYLESISLLTTVLKRKVNVNLIKIVLKKLHSLISNITAHYETSIS